MRKILQIAIILILPLFPSFAGDLAVEFSLGLRETLYTSSPGVLSLGLSYDDLSLYAMAHGDEEQSIAISYHPITEFNKHEGGTFLDLSIAEVHNPGLGGWADAAIVFGQVHGWKHFSFSYSAGFQIGLSFSEYSDLINKSFSPLVSLSGAFIISPVTLSVYLTMTHPAERQWKALPVAGIRLDAEASEHSSFYLDIYAKAAEYLIDPVVTISGYSIRVGYIYRGAI